MCDYKENCFLYSVNVFLSKLLKWIYSTLIMQRKVTVLVLVLENAFSTNG